MIRTIWGLFQEFHNPKQTPLLYLGDTNKQTDSLQVSQVTRGFKIHHSLDESQLQPEDTKHKPLLVEDSLK